MRCSVAVALVFASVVLVSGCSGPGPVDAGSGGGTGGAAGGGSAGGGGSVGGGGGGATGGGGGAIGGGGGATSDGGNAGTLAGALSFPIQAVLVKGSFLDGGPDVSLMTVLYLDHAPAGPACNPTITVPITAVQFTVQMFDGGALRPGTYDFPWDVYGKREALTASSQETQYITQGSITLTRLDTRSTGTLSATLDHGDGGTSTLSGTWDGLICP